MKDQLYLLKPDFFDNGKGPFFCPECALVEGMLSFYPALREQIDVHYLDFQRPRQILISILGEDNQSAPKLIFGDSTQAIPQGLSVNTFNGEKFISGQIEICNYLAAKYGYGMPH